MSVSKFRIPKPEVGDDVLLSLALELEREQEETLQRLCDAVLSHDYQTAELLAKEIKGAASN